MELTAARRPANKGRRYPADPPRVAVALRESDLELNQGSIVVRSGKGDRRRTVGMDEWGWQQLRPWLEVRRSLPVGPLFCVINPPRPGKPWTSGAARCRLARVAADAGVRRRFAPHQLRHAHAVEMAREGVPLNVIQRQLGHAHLGVTSIYPQGIDTEEIVETVRGRRSPVVPAATALLR
jgi:site-specific recombinase XerD